MPPAPASTYYTSVREEMVALLPPLAPGATILEIGCAEGKFSSNFTGDRVYWGIEPTPEVARIAATRLDRVLVGTFREVFDQLPDRSFDCVVCNDVVEHMDDHDWFLQAIKPKLREGGVLVGSIPNVRYLTNLFHLVVRKDWQYADQGTLDRTHLRFFTERSLRRTFATNGYAIEAFKGINGSTWARARRLRDKGLEIAKWAVGVVLGSDTRHLQFAFRVTPM